uniref:Uncharacterized protein n=1 Tax=Arundo donax TaxID=35708 RepID=A0A0A9AKU5_ARUDO
MEILGSDDVTLILGAHHDQMNMALARVHTLVVRPVAEGPCALQVHFQQELHTSCRCRGGSA